MGFDSILSKNFKKFGASNPKGFILNFIKNFVENFILKMPFHILWIAELEIRKLNYLIFVIFIDSYKDCKIPLSFFISKKKKKIKKNDSENCTNDILTISFKKYV